MEQVAKFGLLKWISIKKKLLFFSLFSIPQVIHLLIFTVPEIYQVAFNVCFSCWSTLFMPIIGCTTKLKLSKKLLSQFHVATDDFMSIEKLMTTLNLYKT